MAQTSSSLKNTITVLSRLVRYNLKIIFANKFIYFLAAAVTMFLIVTAINFFDANANPDEGMVYRLLLVPGILLIFYPVTFGIQNDVDNRMIEILFGIPNYRYKVWLFRLILIFTVTFLILSVLATLSSLALAPISIAGAVRQLMFPVVFLGCASFFVSTVVRNGSGTAVVMVIVGSVFTVARDFFADHRTWDIFLNPFILPDNVNEAAWADIIAANRTALFAGIVLTLLGGLLNLQKREKFLQ
ncbi:MAG: hypothetical protein J7M24_01635 [Candidatus Latescibacteria bacterium]|nr:hypothetical protein [Candidatus Latescibacterota bacterium]